MTLTRCTEVEYEGISPDTFYDLSLPVRHASTLSDALRQYLTEEVLDGDNKYDAGKFGRQPAVRVCIVFRLV